MEKTKKVVIVGAGEFGEIAYEYFTEDSLYEVAAFAVERKYRLTDELDGLLVIDFEDMEKRYPPSKYEAFVAVTYVKLNRARRRLFELCKQQGYTCATYVSSHSFCWKNAEIGENSFVFENNTIQYHAKIGNNVVLWSGNHIGHRTVIEDDVWLTSHDVISGFCRIGRGSFLGVNVSIGDHVSIAEDVVVGAGSVAVKNLEQKGGIYIGAPAKLLRDKTAYTQFGLEENEV